MKFSIYYYKDFRHYDTIDEIILEYNSTKDNIISFVNKYYANNKRIVVDISQNINNIDDVMPIINMLYQDHKYLALKIAKKDYEKVREAGIPFFFAEYCKTPDQVYAFIKKGCSDVYIVESLGFNLEEIGSYCKSKKVNVRVIPNVAQYCLGEGNQIPDEYKFFIRPDDIEVYEPYVDIFEIAGPADRLSVVYEIYKSGKWNGDLNELILGFNNEFPNTGIVPYFAPSRIKCKHKCMQEKCFLCQGMQEISKQMIRTGLEVKGEKNV